MLRAFSAKMLGSTSFQNIQNYRVSPQDLKNNVNNVVEGLKVRKKQNRSVKDVSVLTGGNNLENKNRNKD